MRDINVHFFAGLMSELPTLEKTIEDYCEDMTKLARLLPGSIGCMNSIQMGAHQDTEGRPYVTILVVSSVQRVPMGVQIGRT